MFVSKIKRKIGQGPIKKDNIFEIYIFSQIIFPAHPIILTQCDAFFHQGKLPDPRWTPPQNFLLV